MAARTPKLTVGIPTYNRSGWLRETLASVLGQSFTDFRILISDNASSDDTAEVVASFEDERIEYRHNERNIGAIPNLNRLVSLTETEFLLLLPDDDLLRPGHLAAAVEALERFPTAGLVHTAFDLIDADSQVLRTLAPLRSRSGRALLEPGGDALRRLMIARWPLCFSSVVYRTEAIRGVGGIPDEGQFADLQLWMRMTRDWDLAYLPAPLAEFRIHHQSASAMACGHELSEGELVDLARRHAQMRHEQRMAFLESAQLERRQATRLRSLADLEFVIESGRTGMPAREVSIRLLRLVRASPRLLQRFSLWHFLLARLGGARCRSALRALRQVAANPRIQRPAQARDHGR